MENRGKKYSYGILLFNDDWLSGMAMGKYLIESL